MKLKGGLARIQTRYIRAALRQLGPLYIQAHTNGQYQNYSYKQRASKQILSKELGKHNRSQMSMCLVLDA